MKQIVRWSLMAVVVIPTFVGAQTAGDPGGADSTPTTRPSTGARFESRGPRGDGFRADGPRGDGPRGDGPRGDGGPVRRGGGREVTPEEWAAVEQFMQANSAVRFDMFKKVEADLGADRPIVQFLKGKLVQRYRELEHRRSDNQALFGFALKQLQYEDAVLGTLRDQRAPEADSAAIERKLDEQIRGFVDNNLADRAARLERLKQIVDSQTKGLAKDRGSIDALVSAQRVKFKREMDAMLDYNAKDDAAATQPTTRAAK